MSILPLGRSLCVAALVDLHRGWFLELPSPASTSRLLFFLFSQYWILGLPEDMISAFPEMRDVQTMYKPSGIKRDEGSR
jgi:hypothetical protein